MHWKLRRKLQYVLCRSVFSLKELKSASHFPILFVTLGAEGEWWLDIDCGQTGTKINETPELRPRHHKLQWSPYNVITSCRRVICHTRAGQQMGPTDCDGDPTPLPACRSLCWKTSPAACEDKRYGKWTLFYVWPVCLIHWRPFTGIYHVILDLRVCVQVCIKEIA